MYILTIAGQEEEGAYAVSNKHGDKTLYFSKTKTMQKDLEDY